MKKLKPLEWFLIAFPTLLILGALFTQLRPDATRAILWRFFPPHRFYVEKIEFAPLIPYEVSRGYDTKVLVVLNHGGARPKWWNAQTGWVSKDLAGQLFEEDQKTRPQIAKRDVSTFDPSFDAERDRYVASYSLRLASLPRTSSALMLRSKIGVGLLDKKLESAVVPFEIEVRAPQQIVTVPPVSRQPAIRLDRVLVTYRSDASTKRQSGDDVEVIAIFSRIKDVPVFSTDAVRMATLHDDKGRHFSIGVSGGGSLRDNSRDYLNGAVVSEPGTRFFLQYSFPLSAKRASHVTLRDTPSYLGSWPLEFSIDMKPTTLPIRKTRTIQTSFTQRPAPIEP